MHNRPVQTPRRLTWRALGGLVLIAAVVAAILHLNIRPDQFLRGFENFRVLLSEAVPPQTAILPTAFAGMFETLVMAFLSTFFGFCLALPLGFAGTRTLSTPWLFVPTRIFCAGVRTLPSLIWAVLFVMLVGFQPLAGVLAMTMYTTGHLAKLQYEGLEGLPHEPIEAARAGGAGFFQVARYVALPEASNMILSQALYMFEYNVRASAIVGFVGAGGIGFYIALYLRAAQYDGVLTLLLVVFATVLLIDGLSLAVRSRYLTAVPGAR